MSGIILKVCGQTGDRGVFVTQSSCHVVLDSVTVPLLSAEVHPVPGQMSRLFDVVMTQVCLQLCV